MAKVGEIQDVANDALLNLEKQNTQILRINDQLVRLEGTMVRTKRYLNYFGKSFCGDKVAITIIIMILLTSGGLIYSLTLPTKA